MSMVEHLYTYTYLLFIVVEAVFMVQLLREHTKPGAAAGALIFLVIIVHTISQLFESRARTPSDALFWEQLNYVTIMWLPVVLIHFASRYFNLPPRVSSLYHIVFISASITLSILALTLPHHDLLITDLDLKKNPFYSINRYTSGVFLFVYYAYVLFGGFVYVYFAFSLMVKHHAFYRKRGRLLILAVLIPLVSAILYIMYEQTITFYYLPAAFFAGMLLPIYLYLKGELFGPLPVDSRTLLQSLLDGVIVLDGNDVIIDFNRRAQEYLPALSDSSIGLTLSDAAGSDELMRTVLVSGGSSGFTVDASDFRSDDQAVFDVRVNRRREQSRGATLVIRNVSEERKVEKQLRENSAVLNEDIRVKGVLIDVMAHDIKSPLMLMKNMVNTDHVPAPYHLHQGIQELDRLFDRADTLIMNTAALREPVNVEMEYPLTAVPAQALWETIQDRVQRCAWNKSVQVSFRCDEDITILAHRGLLSSALLPIVENGIKYSVPGGSVTVSVTAKERMVTLAIADDGCGYDDEALACLEQGRWGITRMGSAGEKGPGIGVYAARRFLSWMNGTLEVDRGSEGGTCVYLKIWQYR